MRSLIPARFAFAACLVGAVLLAVPAADARPRRKGKVTSSRSGSSVRKSTKKVRRVAPPARRSIKKVRRVAPPAKRIRKRVRRTRTVVAHHSPRRVRKVVHVHRRPARRVKVVHVHRRPARTRTVVVHRHDPAPRTVIVHDEAPVVEGHAESSVAGYIGAGLAGFAPLSVDAEGTQGAGVNVHTGLVFDDRFGLELGWTGTMNDRDQLLQSGTLDLRAYLTQSALRPYLQAGGGIYALQQPGNHGSQALVGPGLQVGGGLELGDGPLTVNAGATWRVMSLSPYDDPAAEGLDISGLGVQAALALRF